MQLLKINKHKLYIFFITIKPIFAEIPEIKFISILTFGQRILSKYIKNVAIIQYRYRPPNTFYLIINTLFEIEEWKCMLRANEV